MFYDSMISKLIVWDASRDAAIAQTRPHTMSLEIIES